jgi:cystathionine gamma-lyase
VNWSLETLVVALGTRPDPLHGSVTTPIYQTSTFAQSAPGEYGLYDYTRTDNPTRTVLQTMLAALEGAKHGLAFASGMAAEDCVFSLLNSGDHVVTTKDAYGGTYRYLEDVAVKRGLTVSYVDVSDEATLEAAIQPETKIIWFESPTNPLLNLVDLEMIARVGKKKGVITCIDNTFAASWCQNPLAFGIDIVMHSGTKSINGHSDVTLGALMLNDDDLYGRLKHLQNAIGATCSPLDCFLAIRGIKTYALRLKAACHNAQMIAEWLEQHPKIERVYYPGLKSHPHYELGQKQMKAPGTMVSFTVKGGVEEAKKLLCSTKLFILAVSLGGVESLIEHPATMTHYEIPWDVRQTVGIYDNLIRSSIGIEDPNDLIADLEQALAGI